MKSIRLLLVLSLAPAATVFAQLPEGPGQTETERLCRQCHEIARSISLRQDRDGWMSTMVKMNAFGMRSNERDFNLVLDYLAKHYPAEDVPKVNVNTARAIEMEATLNLRRSQAAAVLAWRAQNGPFKNLDDLKKVPGLEAAKLDKKKDRITF